jgi:hypothetical protein
MNRVVIVLAVVLAVGALALAGSGAANAQDTGGALSRCKQVCTPKAQAVLQACLATGAAPERCRQRASTALQDCVTLCARRAAVTPAPGATAPRACELRCDQLGRKLLAVCVALPAGPTREQCQRRALQATQLCVSMTCPKEPVQPDACRQQCRQRVAAFLQTCRNQPGAVPERCQQQSAKKLDTCVAACP